MDQTYVHLIITDLPIFASILGGFVLAYGIWRKSDQTIIAAYLLLIISAIGAGISYYTGQAAKETMQSLLEDFNESASGSIMERHKEFALYALIGLIVLGVTALIGLFVTLKKFSFARTVAFLILLVSLISFGLVAKTGSLGGKIRHTEIRGNGGASQEGNDNEQEMEHEMGGE